MASLGTNYLRNMNTLELVVLVCANAQLMIINGFIHAYKKYSCSSVNIQIFHCFSKVNTLLNTNGLKKSFPRLTEQRHHG
jgi:hypothetical protein